jgi:hypothetical protein
LGNPNAFRSPYDRHTHASVRLFGTEIADALSALDRRVAKHASAVRFRVYALFLRTFRTGRRVAGKGRAASAGAPRTSMVSFFRSFSGAIPWPDGRLHPIGI